MSHPLIAQNAAACSSMLWLAQHARACSGTLGHAALQLTSLVTSAGPACKWFAQHAARMLRVLDAKTFRGDVSEKLGA